MTMQYFEWLADQTEVSQAIEDYLTLQARYTLQRQRTEGRSEYNNFTSKKKEKKAFKKLKKLEIEVQKQRQLCGELCSLAIQDFYAGRMVEDASELLVEYGVIACDLEDSMRDRQAVIRGDLEKIIKNEVDPF